MIAQGLRSSPRCPFPSLLCTTLPAPLPSHRAPTLEQLHTGGYEIDAESALGGE